MSPHSRRVKTKVIAIRDILLRNSPPLKNLLATSPVKCKRQKASLFWCVHYQIGSFFVIPFTSPLLKTHLFHPLASHCTASNSQHPPSIQPILPSNPLSILSSLSKLLIHFQTHTNQNTQNGPHSPVLYGSQSRTHCVLAGNDRNLQPSQNDSTSKSSCCRIVFPEMSESTEIENLKKEFENTAAELKEAKGRDTTGSGMFGSKHNHGFRHHFLRRRAHDRVA